MATDKQRFFKPNYDTEAGHCARFLTDFTDDSMIAHQIHGKKKYIAALVDNFID